MHGGERLLWQLVDVVPARPAQPLHKAPNRLRRLVGARRRATVQGEVREQRVDLLLGRVRHLARRLEEERPPLVGAQGTPRARAYVVYTLAALGVALGLFPAVARQPRAQVAQRQRRIGRQRLSKRQPVFDCVVHDLLELLQLVIGPVGTVTKRRGGGGGRLLGAHHADGRLSGT